MLFLPEDIYLVIKTITNEQRQAITEAGDSPELFFGILTELNLGYWKMFLELVDADASGVSKAVCKAVLSDNHRNRQLGMTLERLLFTYVKNNDSWVKWLRTKGCKMHPNAIEVVLFNGLVSGEFDRFIDTLRLLGSGRAHVVYRERVCPDYDSSCLFCENGVQYFPAGTVYELEEGNE